METVPKDVYTSPAILYIFCFMSAALIFAAMTHWVWLMRRENNTVGSLKFYILRGQAYNAVGVTIFSLLNAVYMTLFTDADMTGETIIPETLILSGIAYFLYRHFKRSEQNIVHGFLSHIKSLCIWVLAGLVSWGVIIGFGYLVSFLVSFLSRNEGDYILFVLCVTAAACMGPAVIMRNFFAVTRPEAQKLRELKVSHLLTISAIAYGIIMLPLGLQDVANSPDFQKQKYEKRIVKT